MVFKIVSGVKKKVWDLYNSDFITAALDVTKQHPDHYKNRVIMNWSSFNASQVGRENFRDHRGQLINFNKIPQRKQRVAKYYAINTLYRGVASQLFLSIPSRIEVLVGCSPHSVYFNKLPRKRKRSAAVPDEIDRLI